MKTPFLHLLHVVAASFVWGAAFAFVLPQQHQSHHQLQHQHQQQQHSVLFAKNGEFSVVEEPEDSPNVDLGSAILVEEEEVLETPQLQQQNQNQDSSDDKPRQRLEYAALFPSDSFNTATAAFAHQQYMQIQVGDLALARKAWKKRRRSGSPLLVPCSVLNLDRTSLVRDNLLYLLYKFGTSQKDGTVLSLGELKRRYKSHLRGSLTKHATALGYDNARDLVEGLFQAKAIQDTYGAKLFTAPNQNDNDSSDEIYLKSTLSKYRALQKAGRATLLQVTAEDDEATLDTMKHTGHVRCKVEQQPATIQGDDNSSSNSNSNNKHHVTYSYPPLSAALRVSQKDDVDSGKIEQGSIHPATFFVFDSQGDGGSPLLTLSLNPARKHTAKKGKASSSTAFTAPKYTPIKTPRYRMEDLTVGDGPMEARVVKLMKDHAVVDLGVGRKFTKPSKSVDTMVGAPEFVKVFGMLQFKDAIAPAPTGDAESAEKEEDVFADMDDLLTQKVEAMEQLEDGEEFEDMTHLFEQNSDGSLEFSNPETGETEIVDAVAGEEEEDDDDEPVTFSVPSSVLKAQRRPRTIRLRPGDTLPVHIFSVSPQSGQFRVTTDPSLVLGKKAKDIKKESGVTKKLERLSQMLGGLHKAEELRGREYDGTVKATSQTGDWLYVQPNEDELSLPVGVATVPEDEVEYSQGDLVRISMEGIDESRGQLAMRVIEKLSP